MAAAALKELCELDELKKDTVVTRNDLSSSEKLLALGDKDENFPQILRIFDFSSDYRTRLIFTGLISPDVPL